MKNATLLGSSSLSLPPGSYIYHLKPIGDKLAAASSDDSLRIFDPTTLQTLSGAIRENVHAGLTCLETDKWGGQAVFTAGRDSAIRCWDIRAREVSTLKSVDSTAYLSLARGPRDEIAVGTELSNSKASIQIWDIRSSKVPRIEYAESHNDDITSLAFHPINPSCLVSGSTDGLVNIYDTRIPDEDDALTQVMNHGASIAHAGFLSDSDMYALSHDETFSIYHLNELDDNKDVTPVVFGDIRPIAKCEYVVGVLSGNEGAILAAGTHTERRLDLLRLDPESGWSMDGSQVIRLPDAHGEEIVRTIYIDTESSVIYTAGEDSNVRAWRALSKDPESRQVGPTRHKRPNESVKKKHQKPY